MHTLHRKENCAEGKMKPQWQIKRTVKDAEEAQKRWDQAYLHILAIAQSVEKGQMITPTEANHASSDICTSVDPKTDPNTDH